MQDNIENVFFTYRGSSAIGSVLRLGQGSYPAPAKLAERLKRDFFYSSGSISDNSPCSIKIKMDNVEQTITFEISSEDDKEETFTLSLPRILGRKDWQFYLDTKAQRKMDVTIKSAAQGKSFSDSLESLHQVLATKLHEALKEKGFTPFPNCEIDYFAYDLIGHFLDYKRFHEDKRLLLGAINSLTAN